MAIGIPSLNKEVLKTVNRDYYDFDYVAKIMAMIKKLKFQGTTLDILLGLYKDNPLTFMHTLKQTLSLEPNRILICVVNPPRDYLIKYFNNDYNKFYKRVNQLQKVVFPMILQLVKNAPFYTCEHLSFRKKDYDITRRYLY